VMLRPLPFPNAERFVHLGWDWGSGEPAGYLTAYKLEYWREHTRSFDAMATWRGGLLRLEAGGEIQGLRSLRVSEGFLNVLGYTPLRGRGFTTTEQ
ncbi:MAG: hypothetical protein GWO00_07050, partial [Gemmatimonadetes bacterium]|nr:hypothetical protein [Gemmatimonadota bacterium]NIU30554.1 hypothetical protein [Gemmatimonadota bacterium]NIU35395.1 hypothetical protein [Gemmatimonadota bacterium]NIV60924.1 hypothetical protein [Gemmatimonadota bacterium]NIV85230.1 hypothetical protein [Gemmatimonadota bacterium]